MMNQVCMIGNLTADAELRETAGGSQLVTFSIAVDDRERVGNSYETKPSFFRCAMFGERAGKLAPMLTKGKKIGISGKLKQDRYKNKYGQNVERYEIVVFDVTFTQSKPKQEQGKLYDEDIPF